MRVKSCVFKLVAIAVILSLVVVYAGSEKLTRADPILVAGYAYARGTHFYCSLNADEPDGKNKFRLYQPDILINSGIKPEDVKQIAFGYEFTLVLKTDGTVWAWGRNDYGQLGDGTTTNRTTPVQVQGLTNVTAISAGQYHSLALCADGSVWAWGYNGYGQLGDGTTTNRTTPVQTKLTNAVAIAAGQYHSLALRSDGTVWACGRNNYGQLGNGTTNDSSVPVQVQGLTDVVAITAGQYHSLALKSDGTVWAWGRNLYGQLGDGTTTNRTTPVQVQGLTNVVAIAAGNDFSLALRADGTVWAWGGNFSGQLGDGTAISRKTPVQVKNTSNVRYINAYRNTACAVKTDGTVWGWGEQSHFKFSPSANSGVATAPVQVEGITRATRAYLLPYGLVAITSQAAVDVDRKIAEGTRYLRPEMQDTLNSVFNMQVISYVPTNINLAVAGTDLVGTNDPNKKIPVGNMEIQITDEQGREVCPWQPLDGTGVQAINEVVDGTRTYNFSLRIRTPEDCSPQEYRGKIILILSGL